MSSSTIEMFSDCMCCSFGCLIKETNVTFVMKILWLDNLVPCVKNLQCLNKTYLLVRVQINATYYIYSLHLCFVSMSYMVVYPHLCFCSIDAYLSWRLLR